MDIAIGEERRNATPATRQMDTCQLFYLTFVLHPGQDVRLMFIYFFTHSCTFLFLFSSFFVCVCLSLTYSMCFFSKCDYLCVVNSEGELRIYGKTGKQPVTSNPVTIL